MARELTDGATDSEVLTSLQETIHYWGSVLANRRTVADEITEADVTEKLRELLAHGFGKLEVVVRDREISTVNWQKSMVKAPQRKR